MNVRLPIQIRIHVYRYMSADWGASIAHMIINRPVLAAQRTSCFREGETHRAATRDRRSRKYMMTRRSVQ